MAESPEHLSDERVKSILARAIEIDSNATTTSLQELRGIAAEIGVSAIALEAALREHTGGGEPAKAAAARRLPTRIAMAGMPMGIVLGSVLAGAGKFGFLLGSFVTGAGLLGSGALIVLEARRGKLGSFNVRNLALWTGIAAGSLVVIAVAGDNNARMAVVTTVMHCARNWIVSSALGSAAMVAVSRMRQRIDRDSGGATANEPSKSKRLLLGLAKRVVRWLEPVQFGRQWSRMPSAVK
jgi:hypothetical protein